MGVQKRMHGPSFNPDDDIELLPNLGPVSAEWLRSCGIRTIADLTTLGPVHAWLLVRSKQPRVTLNLLWGLAAGLQDRNWKDLSAKEKEHLRQQAGAQQ